MATTFPREPIRLLIALLAGYDESTVRWKTTPKNFAAPIGGQLRGTITLNRVARVAIGNDEARYTWDGTTSKLTQELGGQRRATVSIRVESFDPDDPADEVLERIRTGLGTISSQATLKANAVAYSDTSQIQDLTWAVDNRELTAASMDLFLNGIATTTPATIDQPGWIEKVTSKSPPVDPATIPAVDLDDAGTFNP